MEQTLGASQVAFRGRRHLRYGVLPAAVAAGLIVAGCGDSSDVGRPNLADSSAFSAAPSTDDEQAEPASVTEHADVAFDPETADEPVSEATKALALQEALPASLAVGFVANKTSFIQNPERGLYKHLDLFEDPAGRTLYDKCIYARERGYSVIYTQAILPQTSQLSAADLAKVTAGFNDIRRCKAKAVVRFYYLADRATCPTTTCIDPPRATILTHIAQLKPYLAQNEDVIMAVKAGFIGPWGEWHTSTLSNPSDQGAILNALLDAVPASRMVQVRTPGKRHAIFSGSPVVDPFNAIGESNGPLPYSGREARTGHHDDCFLGSLTDYGTYSAYGSPAYLAERRYIALNTRYSPMGGETCNFADGYRPTVAELSSRASEDLAQMHWTFLNGSYSESVNYMLGARYPNYDDPSSGYHVSMPSHTGIWPEIIRRLGYRFLAPAVSFSPTVQRNGNLQFQATIRNVGYAALFNRRPVFLVLHNSSHTVKIPLKVDPRSWEPGLQKTFTATVRAPAWPGQYTVSLWLPDQSAALQNLPEYAVRFAHPDASWDANRGLNIIKVNGLQVQ